MRYFSGTEYFSLSLRRVPTGNTSSIRHLDTFTYLLENIELNLRLFFELHPNMTEDCID